MKYKLHLFLIAVLFTAFITKAQDDPRWNTPSTLAMSSGHYSELPDYPYVNPNNTPRIVTTPTEVLLVNPSIRVLPNTNSQTELYLTINRNNPLQMFGSSNAVTGGQINSGSYISTNGGVTWFGQDFINNGNTNNQRGDPGPIYGANNRIIFSHLTSATNFGGLTGMGAEFSTNNGQNFSATVQLVNDANCDKNLSGADDVPTSPFFGNFYVAWTSFGTSPANSRFARTTDGGVTWQAPIIINTTPAGHNAQGHDVAVTPTGTVVVCWTAGVTASPFTEDFVGTARSTNGGVSFTPTENAFDDNGSRSSSFNGWGIRTNGFPRIAADKTTGSRSGWLYIVVSQFNLAPAGSDADVVLHRSTDQGQTWSAGIRVNQDPLNNGKVQFFPAVSVDENGGVNVAYYDNRNFPSVGDSATVMISRSLDGGNTWTDIEVPDHHFKPKPAPGFGGGYMGDYIGCASGNGKVWAFWMDDKANANFSAWAGYITSGPAPANDVSVGPFLSFPGSFTVNQAYTIRARVTNGGTNGQTNLPIRFSVNGTIQTTNTIASLPAGASDSSSFSWTPTVVGSYTLRIFSGAATDENRNNDTVTQAVTVQPTGLVNVQTTLCRNNVNLLIPDNATVKDSIVVNIANAFNVVDVNVRIDTLTHTWDSDLSFTLTRGAGSCNIISAVGGSGDNFIGTVLNDSAATLISSGTAPFTGSFKPSNPLSSLNGVPVNGSWVLSITDGATGDTGLLKAWCIQVTYQTILGINQTIEIPNYYSLAQNYPNPFNPTTSIKFSVPKAVNVTLKVFDVLGKEVATLVNEVKQPGFYTADFNASNLASGIYFYRIDAGEFTSVKKMMLIK